MGWMQVEPQQRNAHPTEEHGNYTMMDLVVISVSSVQQAQFRLDQGLDFECRAGPDGVDLSQREQRRRAPEGHGSPRGSAQHNV